MDAPEWYHWSGGLFLRVRITVLFPYFVGADTWDRGHFVQLILRLADRWFVALINPLGSDLDL